MYCLCHFLPFLFIPTGASPYFLVIFIISLLLFHRPCIYCSFILITLFSMMCYWREECYFDFNEGRIFEPKILRNNGEKTRALLRIGRVEEIFRKREWRQPLVKRIQIHFNRKGTNMFLVDIKKRKNSKVA